MFSFVAGFCMPFLTLGGEGATRGLICNELLLGPYVRLFSQDYIFFVVWPIERKVWESTFALCFGLCFVGFFSRQLTCTVVAC
jgi:hypothetical protein